MKAEDLENYTEYFRETAQSCGVLEGIQRASIKETLSAANRIIQKEFNLAVQGLILIGTAQEQMKRDHKVSEKTSGEILSHIDQIAKLHKKIETIAHSSLDKRPA